MLVARLIAFALPEKPLSYNSSRKEAYVSRLRGAFLDAGGALGAVDPPHYGLVYFLYKVDVPIDADNMSKPVWDALRGLAFEDDATVRLRVAGKIGISGTRRTRFDLSGVPNATAERLTTYIGSQRRRHDYILYVELGTLRDRMFAFGLAS